MTDNVEWQDKEVKNTPKEKSPAEKFLEEKRNAALGISSSNQFGNRNPISNRQWFAWKTGGGKSGIRKHAARSR